MYKLTENEKIVLLTSILFIILAVFLDTKDLLVKDNYQIKYEYINIKDMARANIATKIDKEHNNVNARNIQEVEMTKVVETSLPVKNDSASSSKTPRRIWYLPTEVGTITQYPSYYHVAYDITSYRGSAETIFPVANGKISGIYTDPDGALMITVLHEIDGQKYTSMYAHLAYYAPNLYVGKDVTINDSLGQMGTTGNSTGIHLHLTLLDCALFDPNDPYCSDLNAWYNYDKVRLSQNFYGLGVVLYVPNSWYNR